LPTDDRGRLLSDDGAWVWDAASYQWLPNTPAQAAAGPTAVTVRDDFFAVERVDDPAANSPATAQPGGPAARWDRPAGDAYDPFAVGGGNGQGAGAGQSVTGIDVGPTAIAGHSGPARPGYSGQPGTAAPAQGGSRGDGYPAGPSYTNPGNPGPAALDARAGQASARSARAHYSAPTGDAPVYQARQTPAPVPRPAPAAGPQGGPGNSTFRAGPAGLGVSPASERGEVPAGASGAWNPAPRHPAPADGPPAGSAGTTPAPATPPGPTPNIFFTPARGLPVSRHSGSAAGSGSSPVGPGTRAPGPEQGRPAPGGRPAQEALPWRSPHVSPTGQPSDRPNGFGSSPGVGIPSPSGGSMPGGSPAGLPTGSVLPGRQAPGGGPGEPANGPWRTSTGSPTTADWPGPTGRRSFRGGDLVIDPRDPLGTGDLPSRPAPVYGTGPSRPPETPGAAIAAGPRFTPADAPETRATPAGPARRLDGGAPPASSPGPVEMTSVLSRVPGSARPGRGGPADPAAGQAAPAGVAAEARGPGREGRVGPTPGARAAAGTRTERAGRTGPRRHAAGQAGTGQRTATGPDRDEARRPGGESARPDLLGLLEPADSEDYSEAPPASGKPSGTGRRFAAEDLLRRDDDAPAGRAPSAGGPGWRAGEGSNDRLAWFRHGWLGPLAVAVTLALVALGLYVLLAGRGGGSATATQAVASSPAAPVGTNPDAKVGKALVDGTYSCQAGPAATAPAAGSSAAPAASMVSGSTSVLVVPATTGTYTWNGQSGTYTIAAPTYDDPSNIIASVTFSSGPLQGGGATSIAGWPKGGGRPTATLTMTKGNSLFCKLD